MHRDRREYTRGRMEEGALPGDPLELFNRWLTEARATTHPDPTAMHLSTVDTRGRPSSRMVLLKDLWEGKLIFFTNYQSRKGNELRERTEVAALFFWAELERQVRIEGRAKPIPDSLSDKYWHSRPLESKIGAWASPQSREIGDRRQLESAYGHYRQQFSGQREIPRPPHWGGYAIEPDCIEFWQGGVHRLHDRIRYDRNGKVWTRVRLAP